MKKIVLIFALIFVAIFHAQVQTTYLWHMHQPTYWGETSKINPNRYQTVKESQDLKMSGGNTYSDGLAHPLNDLNEIFGSADRVNAYQFAPKNAVNSIRSLPNAGAQITYGGSLIENINSLAAANQWGYVPSWKDNVNTAHSWLTSGGKPRMDVMGFTMHHTLSPLASDEVLKKEIEAHKYYQTQQFGYYSNGFWPAEASFSENIIKVLKEEGFNWTVVANSHLARTLADYPLVFGTNGCNIDPPNKADKVETTGVNWSNGQIDGRGGQFAAPYCFTPHKAKYVDPETGVESIISIIPMAELDSYKDGFSQQGTDNIDTNIAPYADPARPPLVLLAHDGDNAWGGGSSYYNEAVPGFSNAAAAKGYNPTTIEQYLKDFPIPDSDVVHVEDGSWFNAANDWGSPQFINWFWPLTDPVDKSKFNPNGWTEDVRNQAVLFAGENFCKMAEELNGGVNIADVVNPTSSSPEAAKAWNFLLPGYDSGNAYYGLALDLEIKATLAANRAISHAQLVIDAHPNVDTTKPSVLVPQRYPYNPGEIGFGPNYGYKQILNSADFSVWTLAFDVSGIQSAVLKYRIDADGKNPLTSNQNETYAGGPEVGSWISKPMNERIFPKDNVTNNPEVSFFMLPDYIANLYWAEINGISEKLLDYYIEVTDKKGNVTKTKIEHVWVGKNLNVNPKITITPESNYSATALDITINATSNSDANPTIYYTLDGTTPTTASSSATSTKTINITTTTTVKAFAKDAEGNVSDVSSKTYYIGVIPTFTVYFKPPTTWTTPPKIYHWQALPTGSLADGVWPGETMTEGCDGWYSYTFTGISSTNIIFNNGTGGAGNQTADLSANGTAYYDGTTNTWLSTPPTISNPCLKISPSGGTFASGTPVNVVLSATDSTDPNPTIYYTTNGTEPSVFSSSFTGNGNLSISANTTLKAFAKNSTDEMSAVKTEIYNFSSSGITVHFKPDPTAAGWNGVTPRVYYWNMTGGAVPAATWPGNLMVDEGNGYFKYTFPGVTSLNVIFNNGNSDVGTNQTPDITNITNDIYYDWATQSLNTNEKNLAKKLILYPNPVKDLLNLKSDLIFTKYALYDSTGNMIEQKELKNNQIKVSQLPTGMYYLKLLSKDGKINFEQFIKQ
ncbi:Por secretion system C-terminal sorting domain-containing protein [Halpernia humi]|uniref:Por secretion system C-terminal sorting domain-containing protein n=1 Tax=Halpernia humi TaxID=493375 RepID=A0A1H5ZNM8_9FLAO|nr:starch-binding protein [Halpernia humi]SEG37267.1 Por secretion system C-terminal sorting domain-containing protein [Halpernia humi]